MKALQVMEMTLWPATIMGVGALAVALTRAPVAAPVFAPVAPIGAEAPGAVVRSPDSLAAAVVARDLFRLDRQPAPRPFQPDPPGGALPPEAEVARPTLALVGIVGGTEPTAIIEGVPGAEGPRVVRAGERIGALHVRRIREGTVEISGMDTLWVLHVREPWHGRR
jgi:hypothetical protein